jgi:hypothetical protein
MVTRVKTYMVDDLDQSEAAETVTFGIDHVQYELDLSEGNASKLRDALAPWVAHARKTGGRRSASKVSSEIDNRAVRAWAQANGIEVSERGRISASVVEQFRASGN